MEKGDCEESWDRRSAFEECKVDVPFSELQCILGNRWAYLVPLMLYASWEFNSVGNLECRYCQVPPSEAAAGSAMINLKDVGSWNYIDLFNWMPIRDDIAWIALILGFVSNEGHEEAIYWFNDMR
ncbi:hypothetical protein Fot_18263 [Forsythia ovata]|uniref:Pentatricopeptide repeat-containing protein n=1 Tax=Forsythia ovata TaxID=205694 RepID=A0ABD1VI20_9LAMI